MVLSEEEYNELKNKFGVDKPRHITKKLLEYARQQ